MIIHCLNGALVNAVLCLQKKVLLGLSVEVIFAAIIIVITMTRLHTYKKRSLMVGVICDIFNTLMYVSPLTVMVRPSLQSHTLNTWSI